MNSDEEQTGQSRGYVGGQNTFFKLSDTITKIVQFTNKHRIEAKFHIHTIGQLTEGTPDEHWARFEKHAGVYVIFNYQRDAVHYVGMSEVDTGSRLFNWIFRDNKVSNAIDKEDMVLSIVLKHHPYMSSALESYLIKELDPKLNARGIA